ncbi:Multiple antibiotic resistance protein marA [Raoultella terrigena]|nr:Multiple antibiotic resistance protein marA [Raoultella terrigena]
MPQDYRAQVFKAIDYISQNLCFNPTLEEIASAVALSSFHFHRIFKAEVGETIAGFTRRLRMEKAAMWLIESPRRDITGLALRVGFSSSQNFAKAFRQHFFRIARRVPTSACCQREKQARKRYGRKKRLFSKPKR